MFTTTRGNSRNNLFRRLWNLITGIVRPPDYDGSQRSRVRQFGSLTSRSKDEYDLEISEYPVRDALRAREIIEMKEYCPEVATAIDWLRGDCPSSNDGDDRGVAIPDRDRYDNPVDAQVLQVARDHLERVWNPSNLEMALERLIGDGDFFAELSMQLRGERQVNGLMFLPTWEMFRVEPQGVLQGFEQRRYLVDSDPIRFAPLKVVHGRYRRKNLYGRSLFLESLDDWVRLKEATEDLSQAARQIGINPTLHKMPEGTDKPTKDAYADEHDMALADGVITHYYLMPGVELEKLSTGNPDLKALVETIMQWRSRIVMKSGVPPYLLGLPAQGARDIAGQPALAYSRRVNDIRMKLSESIRQTINTELALKQIPQTLWNYRITWPKFSLNVLTANEQEANLGESPDHEDTEKYRDVFASHAGYSRLER